MREDKAWEDIRTRIRAHANTTTEETNVNDDRIERDNQDSSLTTADLARSAANAETEERAKENWRGNPTPDNRSGVAQPRDAARTNVNATPDPGAMRWQPATTAGAAAAATPAREGEYARLFSEGDAKGFRARWESLQVSFVDEPRHAVEQADSLVAEAIKRLAEVFADERQKLEGQWDRGDNVSTEDLRVALQRYRAFFGRLLSV
jgi:hypothetical protein